MIKVIFSNSASGTVFAAKFNTKEAALDACKWYMSLHSNNEAQPFDDSSSFNPMQIVSETLTAAQKKVKK